MHSSEVTPDMIAEGTAAITAEIPKVITNLNSLQSFFVEKGGQTVLNEVYAQKADSVHHQKNQCFQQATKLLQNIKLWMKSDVEDFDIEQEIQASFNPFLHSCQQILSTALKTIPSQLLQILKNAPAQMKPVARSVLHIVYDSLRIFNQLVMILELMTDDSYEKIDFISALVSKENPGQQSNLDLLFVIFEMLMKNEDLN